ncbi:DUF4349 domain-containing protein [Chitinophaga flava]|uniref:DUF4349 domain-containing protein n=1 Tax=Chitinophaga flava TaxID=2259036 RepID=A0A365XTY0_9BACT|nr:DUF4349 domain-containing protein [Chitinophaga flava]RBL89578.1 hypothetical protein DF182_24020 [Chitinophaga flava]
MRLLYRYAVLPAVVLAACSQSNPHDSSTRAADDETSKYVATADSTGFSNDIASLTSPSRKRVRTADVRCRVGDVFTASTRMERTVAGLQGVVVESTMKNKYNGQYELPYTADSLKRMQLYTPTANLTLRVPVAHLDSVVSTLTSMAAFIDYRVLTDKDYTLSYLSNSLKNDRTGQSTGKTVPGKKSTALDVAKYEDQKAETNVDRSIANLQILDDVAYATFTVELFQSEVANVETVINPRRISRAAFGTELLNAVREGASLLRDLLLFFVQIWPLLILAVLGWFGYKRYRIYRLK